MKKPGLSSVSNVIVHDSGRAVSLCLKNDAGNRFDMALSKDELTQFIENLIDLGISAAKIRTDGNPVSMQSAPPGEFSDNEITGIAIGESPDKRSLVLALRLYDYDLTFATDRSIVFSLADSFTKMAEDLRKEDRNAE